MPGAFRLPVFTGRNHDFYKTYSIVPFDLVEKCIFLTEKTKEIRIDWRKCPLFKNDEARNEHYPPFVTLDDLDQCELSTNIIEERLNALLSESETERLRAFLKLFFNF